MYKIIIDHECDCFQKSGFKNHLTFEDKQDALAKARVMECRMNQEFCFKHYFEAVDKGDEIVIYSTLQPEDDEDDYLDLKEMLSKTNVYVHFDGTRNPQDKY